MSKKSRRRNKKILGALALLGTGLAMANRNKRNAAIEAGVQSQKDDSGSDMLEFKEKTVTTPNVVTDTPKINNNTFRTRGKITDSAGNTIDSAGMTLNRRANAVTGVDGSPTIINPYSSRNIRGRIGIGRPNTFKSGGRVKGAGCAKRGFGKAFKGGKK